MKIHHKEGNRRANRRSIRGTQEIQSRNQPAFTSTGDPRWRDWKFLLTISEQLEQRSQTLGIELTQSGKSGANHQRAKDVEKVLQCDTWPPALAELVEWLAGDPAWNEFTRLHGHIAWLIGNSYYSRDHQAREAILWEVLSELALFIIRNAEQWCRKGDWQDGDWQGWGRCNLPQMVRRAAKKHQTPRVCRLPENFDIPCQSY